MLCSHEGRTYTVKPWKSSSKPSRGCDCMFHPIQNNGVCLNKAMLCSLPARKGTEDTAGLGWFCFLFFQTSQATCIKPHSFSEQWLELLMWRYFLVGWDFPFPSPHNLSWFLAYREIQWKSVQTVSPLRMAQSIRFLAFKLKWFIHAERGTDTAKTCHSKL